MASGALTAVLLYFTAVFGAAMTADRLYRDKVEEKLPCKPGDCPTSTSANTSYTGCECDFILVLESSHRLTCYDFDIVKQFGAKVALSYARSGVRIGVVAFGAEVFDTIHLDQYTCAAGLAAAILRMPCQSSVLANTESGFAGAKAMFELYAKRGARAAILISNGLHQLGNDPVPTARALRDMGVETLVIGVSGLATLRPPDTVELAALVDDPNLFLPLKDTRGLIDWVDWLRDTVPCEHCPPTTTTTTGATTAGTTTPSTTTTTNTPYTGCECDFVLVLETSHRLTCGNFEIVKQFGAAVAQSYAFGERGVRFGVVAFGSSVSDTILFDQYSSAADLAAAIRCMTCQGAALADTESGLTGAKAMFDLYAKRGARATILISDGRRQLGEDPLPAARALRDMGVETVAIGVPGLTSLRSKTDDKELAGIAGPGSSYWHVNNITSLAGVRGLVWIRDVVPCGSCQPRS